MALTPTESQQLATLLSKVINIEGVNTDLLTLIRSAGQGGAVDIATHNNDAEAHGPAIATHNSSLDAHAAMFGTKIRNRLTANTTFYLRSDGNDSNTGLGDTAGAAWKTLPGALNHLRMIDQAGFIATLSLQGGVNFGGVDFGHGGYSGRLRIKSTNPDNLALVGNVPINFKLSYSLDIYDVIITGTLSLTQGGIVNVGYGTRFVPAANSTSCVMVWNGSTLILWDKVSFTGEGFRGLTADGGNIFSTTALIIDFEGFTAGHSLIHSLNTGRMVLASATFTGSAAGRRYIAQSLGQIITLKGVEAIPGTIAGLVSTEGKYI